MVVCPKCRSYNVGGPRYHKGGYGSFGVESLVYRCNQCGYEEHQACADADAQAAQRLPHDAA